ncbi:MAG TPA: 16S rRNA (cytosine(1402)-N(4))-methyltransferase RsmH [bacterium]|nr:16S rRNA (cytosine(1402)-N(4))-methyltransferase RsmH [bacterium]HQG44660.1 16S rRNA (cytosine(1402)-N(4))-methyltransferase RsmH [bacterium]HQI48280.1 16S rRNA (cytosine(1402)-N(4))-methyltransferase RsmH [bacterium]HQJ64896.1 16S rRNA (cytosine(1402)-N(4))-methyltransferase RsmH [bacterium]
MEGFHQSVLVREVLELLQARQAKLVYDVTAGDGGHLQAFLQTMPSAGRVVGIDRDPEALRRLRQRLASYTDRFQVVRGNFRDLETLLADSDRGHVDAILADLGISTLQITDPEKGFMFSADGPLSMQMDPQSGMSAAEVVNEFDAERLGVIIRTLGEERAWRRIAQAIVRARSKCRIERTSQLAAIVRSVVPGPFAVKSCARVFQSLRIFVNDELKNLELFLPQALTALRPGGRLGVISFHSLEDRIVKEYFRQQADPCICPPKLPVCVCGAVPQLRVIGKLVVPAAAEVALNPSARSAKLRVAEKLQQA